MDNTEPPTILEDEVEQSASRRNMLRLAGAAVAGGAAAVLVGGQPAAATAGDNFVIGNSTPNDAGIVETTLIADVDGQPALTVTNDSTTDFSGAIFGDNAVTGVAGAAQGGGTGVVGVAEVPDFNGWGVLGIAAGVEGIAIVAFPGRAHLGLAPLDVEGLPIGDHLYGEVLTNNTGIFYCLESGNGPGGWTTLADIDSAGVFHAISPARVYDSRKTFEQVISSGQNRTVSVADKRDPGSYAVTVPNVVPVGATAITYNITITGTFNGGFLSVNEGGNTVVAASTINWSATGLTIANGSVGKLDGNRQITVICGPNCSTHFIIDVTGYYR